MLKPDGFFYYTEPESLISEIADIVLCLKSFSARLKWRSFWIILLAAFCWFSGADLTAQTGPGGVGNTSNNLLWLKADAGTSTTVDGNRVSSWLDQSGNAMNATQVVRKPSAEICCQRFQWQTFYTFK